MSKEAKAERVIEAVGADEQLQTILNGVDRWGLHDPFEIRVDGETVDCMKGCDWIREHVREGRSELVAEHEDRMQSLTDRIVALELTTEQIERFAAQAEVHENKRKGRKPH